MNFVWVPYCTGDMHSGDTIANFPNPDGGSTYFYGGRDMDIFLARLVPTFSGVTRIWLIGDSAGGFGTYLTFDRIERAFGVGIDIIDDSGPPLVSDGGTDNAHLFGVWGSLLPDAGFTSLRQVLDYDLGVQQSFSPPGEFGFLSFLEDKTIGPDFNYDPVTEYPGLMEAFSASLPDSGIAATFLVANYQSHVVQSDANLIADYLPWMAAMVARDGGWGDVLVDGG